MQIDFSGKTALVTGAGRGIGRQTVVKLLECGANVIAVSKTASNLLSLKEQYPALKTVCVDLSNWDETKKALKDVGPVDLLVNNAAYAKLTPLTGATSGESVEEITENDCDDHFNINVKAVVNVTQIIAKGMIKREKGGAIVNVSSQAGIAALKDHLVYSATKGAVDAMTKVMALEYGPFKIRTNSINPTVTMTEMAKVGWSDPKIAKSMRDKIPLGKFAEVDEVVDVILYLLSDRASMINGVLLPIDGGFCAC